MGVECRIEPLSLGDFVWAVEKIQPGDLHGAHSRKGLKLVLDHVVERKRMDDLSSSIVDKRYIEQKSRFRQAGFIRNPIYLVEDMGASMQRWRRSLMEPFIIILQFCAYACVYVPPQQALSITRASGGAS